MEERTSGNSRSRLKTHFGVERRAACREEDVSLGQGQIPEPIGTSRQNYWNQNVEELFWNLSMR